MIFLNTHIQSKSIEESHNFSTDMPVPALLGCVDSLICWHYHVSKLPRWQDIIAPFLEISDSDIIARTDHITFIDSTNKFDDNLLRSMIVNDFELANIALFLHDFKKPDNNFGDWFYDNLFLAFFLSIHNSFEAVSQHIHFYHSLIF